MFPNDLSLSENLIYNSGNPLEVTQIGRNPAQGDPDRAEIGQYLMSALSHPNDIL
jgi:hypothetical protein